MHLDRSLFVALMFVTGSLSVKVETPRQSISAPVGDEVEFICHSNADKRACLITTPYGQAKTMYPGILYEEGRLVQLIDEPRKCGIRITKLEEKDNGEWKCGVEVIEDNKLETANGSMMVTVSLPPQAVELRSDGIVVTNDKIQIEMEEALQQEGNDPNNQDSKVANSANARNFSCVAVHARPKPEFKWFIGNTEIEGHKEDTVEESLPNGVGNFVQTLRYFPDSKHNGHVLRCELEHTAYTEKQIADGDNIIQKELEILFAPKSKDKAIPIYGLKENEENTVTIKFEANPQPSQGFWNMVGPEPTEIAIGAESVDQKYKSGYIEPTEIPGEYSVSLTIKSVTREMEGKSNKLTVTNDRGTTEYKFVLRLGEKPPAEGELRSSNNAERTETSGDNLGSGPVIGVIVVVAIVVLLIGIAIVARSKGILCFAAKNGEQLQEEKAFDNAEKGEPLNPKAAGNEVTQKTDAPTEVKVETTKAENEEKKSNGAHTPV